MVQMANVLHRGADGDELDGTRPEHREDLSFARTTA